MQPRNSLPALAPRFAVRRTIGLEQTGQFGVTAAAVGGGTGPCARAGRAEGAGDRVLLSGAACRIIL